MRLTLESAPASEPVTRSDAKDHLRVDHTTEDTYIDALITAARQHVENVTNRALISQTWKLYLDRFPIEISLPRAPIQSVNSIEYVDSDGVTQTLSSSIYTVDTDSEPGLIYKAYYQTWPSIRDVEKAITITYVAGYGDSGSDVPGPIIQAIKLLVSHMYENREPVNIGSSVSEIPMAIDALLAPYRVWTF